MSSSNGLIEDGYSKEEESSEEWRAPKTELIDGISSKETLFVANSLHMYQICVL